MKALELMTWERTLIFAMDILIACDCPVRAKDPEQSGPGEAPGSVATISAWRFTAHGEIEIRRAFKAPSPVPQSRQPSRQPSPQPTVRTLDAGVALELIG